MKRLFLTGVAALSVSVAHANEAHRTVLGLEWGGKLIDHIERWQALDKSGDVIEIRGPCVSACTMVMAFIPRERLLRWNRLGASPPALAYGISGLRSRGDGRWAGFKRVGCTAP